jgi:ATP-dependent helicase/nuclease subunit A
MTQPTLFDLFAPGEPASEPDQRPAPPPDQAARDFAIDPAHDVVLEASAGTGKTRVLVDRYLRLLEAGVDPKHILAITFTRKAAAEMRARVLAGLQRHAAAGELSRERWRSLRERMPDIQISTIDAFCFSLLREFPLEANVDPAFEIADETEIARFGNEALELAMRVLRGRIAIDEPVRLLLARVKWPVLRDAVAGLLDRRQIALPAVASFVARLAAPETSAAAGAAFIARLRGLLNDPAVTTPIFRDGPLSSAEFRWLHDDLAGLAAFPAGDPARVQRLRRRLERYFLTKDGKPRQKIVQSVADHFATPDARRRHERAVQRLSAPIAESLKALDRDVNALLSRGLLRLLGVAADRYEQLLHDHALLDFAGMLERAVMLLERQEEFARSRLKLQSRFHHLLVDEFQDTSRLQWRLIELLVDAWGEGEGVTDAPTSIFVVGDRKQSIYRFRHAEVTLLDEAARKIGQLRPGRRVRQAITTSFRAVPELLAFVNALSTELRGSSELEDRFRYDVTDRFEVPAVGAGARRDGDPVLGIVAQPSMEACAEAVATEIARLLATTQVRDRTAGMRPARPEDIAILFRARTGHQYFEQSLEARGIRTYVYKGLGFFDAPEVQDLQALLRYLAEPDSPLRTAELLRSRIVRLSDPALAALAPDFAAHLDPGLAAVQDVALDEIDRALLERARLDTARWRVLAARLTPSELVDRVLTESAYAFELRGVRRNQARENVKKVRDLIRRVENRGYATVGRIADYFETLRAGDESNAIIEAAGAVNLMTIHSAKGLEFPIVFVVNLHVGGRARPPAFSLVERGPDGEPEVAFNESPGTKLEDERETEELRRLSYVAVTRARDRLYLAAEVDERGRLRRRGRSLAGLLPDGLQVLFGEAWTAATDTVTWTSESGTFDFAICRPAPLPSIASTLPHDGASAATAVAPPARLIDRARRRVSATSSANDAPSASADGPRSERLVGTLVHRLFERDADTQLPDHALSALTLTLVRREEAVDVPDLPGFIDEAVRVYRALRSQGDVSAWLEHATPHYEVPFSYVDPARPDEIVRGTLDCVLVGPDGVPVVLEFKTGARRAEHQAQAAIYEQAARAVLGVETARVRLVYLESGPDL